MTLQQANELFGFFPETPASDIPAAQKALDALDDPMRDIPYVVVSGSAGKTAVASAEAAILTAQGYHTGLYVAGTAPLQQRILVDGAPADEAAFLESAQILGRCEGIGRRAAELLCAAGIFAAMDCDFAVAELADTVLAKLMPKLAACGVTHIGPDGTGHSIERMAALAADTFRHGVPAVTAPNQPKKALTEIIVAAGKVDCPLTVPEPEDFTECEGNVLENPMDYGGYQATLPHLGAHAAENASVAIELALAMWREGTEISDEAILAGVVQGHANSGIHVLKNRPLTVVDTCHTPLQAAALAAALAKAGFAHISAVAGLSGCEDIEGFFDALETGNIVEGEKTDKSQMAGMTENAIDKLYLVTPDGAGAVDAGEALEAARYHFDAQLCDTLGEALERARADANEGVILCGGEALVRQAEEILE